MLYDIALGKLPRVEVRSISSLAKDLKSGYPYYLHVIQNGLYLPYYANGTRHGIYVRGRISNPPILGITKVSIIDILKRESQNILPSNVWSSENETHIIVDTLRNRIFLTSKTELNFFYKMLLFYNNLPIVDLAIVGGQRVWFVTSTNRTNKGKKYV